MAQPHRMLEHENPRIMTSVIKSNIRHSDSMLVSSLVAFFGDSAHFAPRLRLGAKTASAPQNATRRRKLAISSL